MLHTASAGQGASRRRHAVAMAPTGSERFFGKERKRRTAGKVARLRKRMVARFISTNREHASGDPGSC